MDYCSLIEGRLRCCSPDSMISDCASHFGIYESDESIRCIGVPSFTVSYNRRYREIANPLLDVIFFLKNGCEYERVEWDRIHRLVHPYGVEQLAEEDDHKIRVTCKSCFKDTNRMITDFFVESYYMMTVRLAMLGKFDKRIKLDLDKSDDKLTFNLKVPRTDQRDPEEYFYVKYSLSHKFHVEEIFLEDTLKMNIYKVQHPFSYLIFSGDIILDKFYMLCLHLDFSIDDFYTTPFILSQASSHQSPIVDDDRTRWNLILSKAPPPPTDDREKIKLYYHAYQVLLNNLYAPMGLYGSCYACFPNKGYYDAHWLWDSAFHMLGLMKLDKRLALDAIKIPLNNQEGDGMIPHFVCATWKRPGGISQPPILSWACWIYYLNTMDNGFLKEVYGRLKRSNEWWFSHRDPDGDCLCEYQDGLESGWDNSPRWDGGRVEAVDLNSFLLLETRILARMAKELHLNEDYIHLKEKGEMLEEKIKRIMYDDEDILFYDATSVTHEHRKVLTLACFTPLWAGVDIGDSKAESMIEEYLLNPKHFYGKIPLPIVAYSDPTYEHNNFWRGPTWFNIAYIILQVLWNYGYEDEADTIAEKLLNIAAKQPHIYEYYDSITGEGLGAKSYGWTAATIIELILGNYRVDLKNINKI